MGNDIALRNDDGLIAIALEKGIGFGDSHGVDLKLRRKIPDGRKHLALLQTSGGNQGKSLIHDLPVDRHPAGWVYSEFTRHSTYLHAMRHGALIL